MPQNWKTYKLTDFIDINPKVKLNRNEEYSFVEMKDLDPNNRTVLPSDYKPLKGGAKFSNGDTLFARITPCLENGKICQVRGLKNNEGFGSTEFLVFRGIEELSDSNFIYYLSREPFVRKFAEANMIGTSGRQRVAKEAFQNLEILLPPLPEQKAIAQILSDIDDKIENNLAINKTLEEMAMALYKHWFVDFGPFQDGAFVESEMGKIPEGWEVRRLEELVDVGSSKRIFLKEYVEVGIPFYRGKEIIQLSRGSNISTELYIKQERFDEIKNKFGTPQRGDILISSVGTIGVSWLVDGSNDFYFKDGNLTWFKNYKSFLKGEFFHLWLNSKSGQQQILGETIGSTQQALTISALRNLKVIVPPISDYKIVEDSLVDIYFKIQNNQREVKTLTQLRDSLLPKLISGEVRLKEFEEKIESAV